VPELLSCSRIFELVQHIWISQFALREEADIVPLQVTHREAGKFPTRTPFQETLDMKRQRRVIAQQDMTKCLPSGCQLSNSEKRLHLRQFFCLKAYLKVNFLAFIFSSASSTKEE
jgi:hypothetical protein